MCLFCAEHMSNSGSETDAREAMTLKLKDNISTRCNVRQDVWSLEVKGRLESIIDLPAAEAVLLHSLYDWQKLCKRKPDTWEACGHR